MKTIDIESSIKRALAEIGFQTCGLDLYRPATVQQLLDECRDLGISLWWNAGDQSIRAVKLPASDEEKAAQ